jgi:hypothetical protein
VWEALVQSQVTINRVPEKVPEKVPQKVWEAKPGQVHHGSKEYSRKPGGKPSQVQQGSGEGSGEALVQSQVTRFRRRFRRSFWRRSGSFGALPGQVQRCSVKVPVKLWETMVQT